MLVLLFPGEIPMTGEILIPFLRCQSRLFLNCVRYLGGHAIFFEDENKFIIQLEDSIPWVRKRSHDRGTARRVACRYLLPDYRPHVVESRGFAEFDDFRADRNDLVSPVI